MDKPGKEYVHQNWDDIWKCRDDKYYFVQISDDVDKQLSEARYQLEVDIPEQLSSFYKNFGYGSLWFNNKQKKWIYRLLSPEEILNLYFEPDSEEEPDDFITYRQRAWENLEDNGLLAFCLFGEEDSLLYIGVSDGAVYYLSPSRKIADSLYEFLNTLDKEIDYFLR